MQIQWFGHSCFRLQTAEGSLIIDPFPREIGLVPPRVSADVVIFSHQHPDHYNKNYAEKDGVFVVDGPGEYEIKGFTIIGAEADHDDTGGKACGKITIFRIEAEGVATVFLSDIGHASLEDGQLEAMGEVDILFVPVGGGYNIGKNKLSTVGARGAVGLINQLEPKIAIPMHYKMKGLKMPLDGVDAFLKEMGTKEQETAARLTVKKKDLTNKTTRVVLLTVA